MEFVQVSIDGILYGASYSLIAVGFSLVFGIMRRINLAFGSSLLLGAAIALWIESSFNLGIFGILPIMIVCSCLTNIYVERICFAPHPSKNGVVVSMIASFAIWMQLDEISSQLLPDRTHSFPSLSLSYFEALGFYFRVDQLINIVFAFVTVALLFFIIYKSQFGILLRAVSSNPEIAKVMGCNISLINMLTFALAGICGGIAAFLILSSESQITPFFGFWCTIKGLVAMMLGGLGSLFGALLGGLILGLMEAHLAYHFGAVFREISTFAILLLILIFKPGGLFGTKIYNDINSLNQRL